MGIADHPILLRTRWMQTIWPHVWVWLVMGLLPGGETRKLRCSAGHHLARKEGKSHLQATADYRMLSDWSLDAVKGPLSVVCCNLAPEKGIVLRYKLLIYMFHSIRLWVRAEGPLSGQLSTRPGRQSGA